MTFRPYQERGRSFAAMVLVVIALIVSTYSFSESADSPTYYKDIAPILEEHCVDCHRPGQVAPMSLMTYEQVRPWAKSIATQVVQRSMPPFHAEGPIGRYRDDPRLTGEQIETVRRWAEGGSPRGNPADFERTRDWKTESWPAGEPDLIVRFPRVELKPDGIDPYVYLFSDYIGTEDLWVRGYDWNFNSAKRVHHISARQLPPGVEPPAGNIADALTTAFPQIPFGSAGAMYLPGVGPHFFPTGSVVKIPGASQIYGIFHYSPSSDVDAWDQPELGFYFANGEALQLFHRLDLITTEIRIPPGESNYSQTIRSHFIEEGYVWDFNVHMHNRGRAATIKFHYPDGTSERVFSLPRFNFDWQRRYSLTEPVHVPKGTEAEIVLVWDNSAQNAVNPNPNEEVVYGPLFGNEMGSAILTYLPADPRFGRIDLKDGRPALSELAKFARDVQAMSWEKLQAFLETLKPDQRKNVLATWEVENGPAPSK